MRIASRLIELDQCDTSEKRCSYRGESFMYRCPRTGLMVQGWIADEPMSGETDKSVTCTACSRVHLINPKTGKILEPTKK